MWMQRGLFFIITPEKLVDQPCDRIQYRIKNAVPVNNNSDQLLNSILVVYPLKS
jgi:hypothetical protein